MIHLTTITFTDDEIEQFRNFMSRAYKESAKAGFVNMFEKDRSIIKTIMEDLNISVDEDKVLISASDSHTQQAYNDL